VELKINRRPTTVSSAAPKPHSRLISRCTEPLVGGTGSGREWIEVMASAALSFRIRGRGSAAGLRASDSEGPFKFQTRSADTNSSEPQSNGATSAGRIAAEVKLKRLAAPLPPTGYHGRPGQADHGPGGARRPERLG